MGSKLGHKNHSWKFPAALLFKCIATRLRDKGYKGASLEREFTRRIPFWKSYFDGPITDNALSQRADKCRRYESEKPETNKSMSPYWKSACDLVTLERVLTKEDVSAATGSTKMEPVTLEEVVAEKIVTEPKFLYVLCCASTPNYSALGITNDISKRVSSFLKGSLGDDLQVFKRYRVEDARRLETTVKGDQTRLHLGHERYSMCPAALAGLVEATARAIGIMYSEVTDGVSTATSS